MYKPTNGETIEKYIGYQQQQKIKKIFNSVWNEKLKSGVCTTCISDDWEMA